MECRNCPYGEEDFKRRMYWYEKTVQERGIPNDIYYHLKPEDAPDEFEQFLWCDKAGGKVYWAGRCTDAYPDIPKRINHKKQKRRSKRERDQKHKNHLKFLAENVQYSQAPLMRILAYDELFFLKEIGWIKNPKIYYKKCYRGNHKKGKCKYYKKYSNRRVRRYKGEIHSKGNQYRKIFDYWWEVG